jgi:N-acylneuraminate cytidylyltransferase/CMP-N,N'-diacetyllegionaminic acid synthase
MDVMVHAVKWLVKKEDYRPDYVLLLQPTSPLRTADDIDSAIELSVQQNADSVVSVCEAPTHPYLTKKVNDHGVLIDFLPKPEGYLPRQLFPAVYALNGAIFNVRRTLILRGETWYTDRTYPYIMPIERSIDIDTPWDMHLADLVLRDKSIVSPN